MAITIKKAKIIDSRSLAVEYTEQGANGLETFKREASAPIHMDLRKAFRRLNMHLALLTEQVIEDNSIDAAPVLYVEGEEVEEGQAEYCLDDDNLAIAQNIECVGFTVSGTGDNEGVTLSGSRELSSARMLNINSPFQKWESDINDYRYIGDLAEIIEMCKNEVYAYFFENKHAPEAKQASIDFPEEEQ